MNISLPRKIYFCSLFLFSSFFFLVFDVKAEDAPSLTVTPSVIDVTCEKGQICLEKKIFIKNNSAGRVDVYAQVNDISPDNGLVRYNDPSELPADASLTRWIEFYRAMITMMPGETATQTLKITASPNAVPGQYHAQISFPSGGNLPEAQQADAKLNQAKLLLNLTIKPHTVEQAEISLFKPASGVFTRQPISFILKIKNIGNVPVQPVGEIVILNKAGKEVGSVAVREKEIAPNETIDFSSAGDLKIGPGKYRARLLVNYGQENKDLTDTIYFSYLPAALLWALAVILLALIGAGAFLIVKRRRERSGAGAAEGSAFADESADDEDDEEYEEEKKLDAPPAKKLTGAKYVINLKKR